MPTGPTIQELDVRPLLAAGKPPIEAILQAVRSLPTGGALRLLAPFEPKPLYEKLGAMGFDHCATPQGDGSFSIQFSPRATAVAPPQRLDLRGLEPPEPMQRTLEATESLAEGGTLVTVTRFCPVHLQAMLEQRGFGWTSTEQADGSWVNVIARQGAQEPKR